MSSQIKSETAEMSQATYAETTYEDASWEIIGAVSDTHEFEPMAIETLGESTLPVDPMFADYGGISTVEGSKRWHLPEGLRHTPTEGAKTHAEEASRIALEESELNQKLQEAYTNGMQEGKQAAELELKNRQLEVEQRINAVLKDLIGQFRQEVSRVEREAVSLSLSIAEKIVGHAVEVNPEYIVVLVKECLALAGGTVVKRVRISPQDMEFIEVLGITKSLIDSDAEWEFEADPTIKSGCIIETSSGSIDVQLEEAWARIKESVLRAIR